MDSGKYIDLAVQNPHGKEMARLIFLPRNFSILTRQLEGLSRAPTAEGRAEGALRALYAAIWAFGVLRLPLSNESYWKRYPLSTGRCPWGWLPAEIYILDTFLDNVIRPQCSW